MFNTNLNSVCVYNRLDCSVYVGIAVEILCKTVMLFIQNTNPLEQWPAVLLLTSTTTTTPNKVK